MKTETKTFKPWKIEVDQAVDRVAGVSCEDLTDQPYWDWYISGMSPKRAAARALADNGF